MMINYNNCPIIKLLAQKDKSHWLDACVSHLFVFLTNQNNGTIY